MVTNPAFPPLDYLQNNELSGYEPELLRHFCAAYGYEFKEITSIDIGLKYAALAGKSIDVTNGYTTDAQLGVQDVVAWREVDLVGLVVPAVGEAAVRAARH